MAQEPGSTRPLTQSEVKEAFASAPYKNQIYAEWRDQDHDLHRGRDLPARVWRDGSQLWYLCGLKHRDGDLPAVVNKLRGGREWYQLGLRHRDGNLPAVEEEECGTMEWWVNDKKTGDQDDPPPGAIFPGQQTKSARKR